LDDIHGVDEMYGDVTPGGDVFETIKDESAEGGTTI
jgi:AGCS family alanine or glycine:cation symporter